MNRPEGITESAWSMAKQLTSAEYDSYAHQVIETASAIQSAVEAERSRCMGIALSFIQYGGDTHHGITENPMADVRDVAAAIRKGA